uniref:Transmembrane protein n=1 Tax=Brassica campestris TaxID=3711 RepID=M4FBU8_BRACM
MDSFFTGFFHSLGNFFGSPLDFLSGKSCSVADSCGLLSLLGSTLLAIAALSSAMICYTPNAEEDAESTEERLRKSRRPRSHRVDVGVRKDHRSSDSALSQHAGGVGQVHGISVSRVSTFARKGSKRRGRVHHGPRRA